MLRLRWTLTLLLSLVWFTMGSAAASAERGNRLSNSPRRISCGGGQGLCGGRGADGEPSPGGQGGGEGGDRWGGTGDPGVQPVLSSQRDGPDALFASVIVNFRDPVFQAAPQLRPQVERVAAGFGQRAAGQEVFVLGGSVEFAHELVEERQAAFRADLLAGWFRRTGFP